MEGNVDIGFTERGELPKPSFQTVEANSFRTRGEPLPIEISGITSDWHSVKGGINPKSEGAKNVSAANFEVLYNPETNQWLKIVPPEVTGEKAKKILKKSVKIAKAACIVAGLSEIADEIKEHEVMVRGKKAYGFVSPHMGQSIYHYAKGALFRQDDKDEVKELVSTVYNIAFQQAVRLYEEYGYWTDDPNPGNILLHAKGDQYHVVLIDFSNNQQDKSVNPDKIPDHIALPGQKDAEVAKRHAKNIEVLRAKFAKQCAISGSSFTGSPEVTSSPISIPNIEN
ncbi:MAG: hypothetical protein H0W89_04485 [Candidatus Levybacteria bacterium]|nr:hypothetical protein [Candidatus Levybacteria bacterium]